MWQNLKFTLWNLLEVPLPGSSFGILIYAMCPLLAYSISMEFTDIVHDWKEIDEIKAWTESEYVTEIHNPKQYYILLITIVCAQNWHRNVHANWHEICKFTMTWMVAHKYVNLICAPIWGLVKYLNLKFTTMQEPNVVNFTLFCTPSHYLFISFAKAFSPTNCMRVDEHFQ